MTCAGTDAAKAFVKGLHSRLRDLLTNPTFNDFSSRDQALFTRDRRWSILTWSGGSYPPDCFELEIVLWKNGQRCYVLQLDGTLKQEATPHFSMATSYPAHEDLDALTERWERAFRKAEMGCATVINTKRKGHAKFCKNCDRQLICLVDS